MRADAEVLGWRRTRFSPMDQQDSDFVERYLRGDADASRVVDGWIGAAAWPFRRRLLADWDDLLQEIRLEIVRLLQAGRFRGESRLKTYLWQVTCHTCLDAIRRERRRTLVGLETVEDAPTSAPSPYETLLRREDDDAALRALATLSGECLELWRRLLRGASYREIGGELGVSEGALRVRAHRCRKNAVDAYRAQTQTPRGDERAVS